jgi:hypothetical protein
MNQCCNPCDFNAAIADLKNQLRVYKTKLSGTSFFIPQYIHKLVFIKGYLILNPFGEEVVIEFKILMDQSVQIFSNVSLDNHTLLLY